MNGRQVIRAKKIRVFDGQEGGALQQDIRDAVIQPLLRVAYIDA